MPNVKKTLRSMVNQRLRSLRLETMGWTKEALAKAAGISAQTVRKAEAGVAVSEVSMAKIAKAFGCKMEEIFDKQKPGV